MSVSLYWSPDKTGGPIIPGKSTAGSVKSALQKTFGPLPIELSMDDMPVLCGMAAVHGRDEKNPYEQIVDLLHQHDRIRITFTV